ncbi:MAG TPA: MOSC N-terminal beta barrel domain-containing protein [Pseudomonadales bacterium]
MASLYVSELFIHPLKSGRGLSVPEISLNRMGVVNDRRWMLVNENGLFLTQRQHRKMALIRCHVLGCASTVVSSEAHALKFSAPGMAELSVEVPFDKEASLRTVRVWGDVCQALDCGQPATDWFTAYLETPASLVYMPDSMYRLVNQRFAKDKQSVNFADGFPLMMIGQGSLDDLNARLSEAVTMQRFRPNMVIAGAAAFAEDTWSRIKVQAENTDIEFKVAKPCSRCAIPGINPDTGEYGSEVLQVLGSYRKQQGKIYFGQNLLGPDSGIIKVGDPVEITPY